jgi:hypothetical protein
VLRRRNATVALAALGCTLVALTALPTLAAAAVFNVDSNAEEPKSAAGAVCETAAGKCTLRAAVEAANFEASFDVIDLKSPPFSGTVGASEVQLTSTLKIEQPATIVGHPVFAGAVVSPSAGVTAAPGEAAFTVEANGVTIEDIAFGGGEYGIEVPGAATGLTVKGSAFGMKLDGTANPIGQAGIRLVSGAEGVTIGGGSEPTEANYFVGGLFGVDADQAAGLQVLGNRFGYSWSGALAEAAEKDALNISSEGLAKGAVVSGNKINATGGHSGIESAGPGSEITANEVVAGAFGVIATNDDEEVGNLIASNQLRGQGLVGIDILNGENRVIGNTITRAGRVGIVVDAEANGNRIGGDAPGEANAIVETLGTEDLDAAITIVSRSDGRNEIAANTGSLNVGGFIKLRPPPGEPGELPNGGIQPPVLAAVRQSSASGTAEANATVRVFAKASPEAGELGALLAVVKADAAGTWTAGCSVPVGTLVAATQTSNAGTLEAATSELAPPLTATADPAPPEEPKTGGAGGSTGSTSNPPPSPPPAKAPKAKILSGPKKSSTATTAKFKFKAEPAAGAKLECKLDNAKWAACRSPKTYKKLKPGKHVFRVRATASGRTGAAAKFEFTVKS